MTNNRQQDCIKGYEKETKLSEDVSSIAAVHYEYGVSSTGDTQQQFALRCHADPQPSSGCPLVATLVVRSDGWLSSLAYRR